MKIVMNYWGTPKCQIPQENLKFVYRVIDEGGADVCDFHISGWIKAKMSKKRNSSHPDHKGQASDAAEGHQRR